MRLVDQGEADHTAHWTAERDRLRKEVSNLLDLAASRVSVETIAPKIREREADIARLDVKLRQPRAVQPKMDELRAALEQRAAEWRETLRAELKVARLLLRRLIGPLTLTNPADHAAFDEWATTLSPALLEGLAPVQHGASPPGFDRRWKVRGDTRRAA